MPEQELNFSTLLARSGLGTLTALEPSPDLWVRIQAARVRRKRRRRLNVFGTAAAILVAGVIGTVVMPDRQPPVHSAGADSLDVDWQARAQALELQLRQLDAKAERSAVVMPANDVLASLEHLDRALQAAYDSGAPLTTVAPLWKQRSELLDALIVARGQQLGMTKI